MTAKRGVMHMRLEDRIIKVYRDSCGMHVIHTKRHETMFVPDDEPMWVVIQAHTRIKEGQMLWLPPYLSTLLSLSRGGWFVTSCDKDNHHGN